MDDTDFVLDLDALNESFRDYVPFNKALGLTLVEATQDPAIAKMRLPYDARFIGNPETGVLHGGVITTLMDAACGASVFFKLKASKPIATLDLRIDYLKPGTPGLDIYARAECFKTTNNVAFVRAMAFHDNNPDDALAAASGTFMISTQGQAVTAYKP
jgi:uncharacterized protein (TIGR00369 family)